jgi:hypothetical protein
MGTPPGWGLEHRAINPVSVKNLTAIEISTIVKMRPYVPVGTKRTSNKNYLERVCMLKITDMATARSIDDILPIDMQLKMYGV